MTSDGFPSMKARAMLRLLYSCGYQAEHKGGSHRRLTCDGRPTLVFAYHDKAEIAPGVVRSILIKQVGLSREEALKVIRRG